MAEDQLLAHLAADLLEIEPAPLLLHDGVERHLHQHITQLFPQHGRVVGIDGFQRLAGLLQKVLPNGLMRLHLVPRAARFRVPQDADDLDEVFRRIVFALRPILHGWCSFLLQK